jgi:hypothetical protein
VNEREEIENEIRELLKADLDSVTLSNKLFQQGTGLFARLGQTEEQRRELVKSDLWKSARARLRELENRDLDQFREVVKEVEKHRPPGSYMLQMEAVQQPK